MTKDGKYKILIITGIVTDGHDPRIVPMLRYMLESTGKFKVKVTEEFRGATEETLEGYDAILYDYDGKENVEAPFVGLGEQAERVMLDFVASGKGAIVFHSGILMGDPVYREEFVKLMGIDLDLMKGTARKSPKYAMRVDIDTEADPITKDMKESFTVAVDDLFVGGILQPGVTVLGTVENNIEDYDWSKAQLHIRDDFKNIDLEEYACIGQPAPVIWKHHYGRGRVFAMSIGTQCSSLESSVFVQLMCRGAEWVCSGEVTLPALDLEYERRKTAWPYYPGMTVQEYGSIKMF